MQLPILPIRRVLIYVCCLLVATIGVAYAAFTSNNVSIPGNTISTASASLELSNDGTTFGRELSGYEFTNLVPGGPPSGDRQIFLRNSGTTRLRLNLLLTPPTIQVANGPLNMNAIYIAITPGGTSDTQSYSFESFYDGKPKSFGPILEPGQQALLTLQAWLDEGAVSNTTEQLVLEGFNMVFGGVPEFV